jgi:hypothetical protein
MVSAESRPGKKPTSIKENYKLALMLQQQGKVAPENYLFVSQETDLLVPSLCVVPLCRLIKQINTKNVPQHFKVRPERGGLMSV